MPIGNNNPKQVGKKHKTEQEEIKSETILMMIICPRIAILGELRCLFGKRSNEPFQSQPCNIRTFWCNQLKFYQKRKHDAAPLQYLAKFYLASALIILILCHVR